MQRTLILALIASLTAACALGNQEMPPTAEHTESDDITDVELDGQDATSPLLPWDQQRFLMIAEQTFVSRCMQEAGFRYEVVEPPLIRTDETGRPYGSDDVGALRTNGYGLDVGEGLDRPTDVNAKYVQGLSLEEQASFTRALFGDDATTRSVELPDGLTISFNEDGCVHEARTTLFGDRTTWTKLFYTVEDVNGAVHARVVQDDRYRAALEAWRSCMSDRGFDFDSPGVAADAAAAAYSESSREEARGYELEIASADGTCNVESALAETGRQVEAELTSDVLGEREGEVIAYRELQLAAIERAKELLGD